ncbi:uncharacterized protein LOC133201019 [Saccostrea echinata]|uniref:uncharacterized protein LOC133201019 n=1 Tax=Saccostrea echinata TaxID=191078 RepID=UPI002A82C172|nr:uncharacterized protein LOC133201019 [Saccostrea echinata]
MDAETPKKRIRKSNWDPREEITLVEEVQKREKVLFGKLDGSGRTSVDKTKAWKEVTDLINAGTKEKRSAILNPKTEGGKKPSSPNVGEQLLLDNLEGRPSLCGLPSGIDTAAESVVDFLDDNHALHEFDLTSETTQLEHLLPQTQPLPSTSTTSSTEPQVHLKVTPEMLLQEELINIKERRKLIKEQQQLAHLQKQHVMLKIKQKDPFFNFEHLMNEM